MARQVTSDERRKALDVDLYDFLMRNYRNEVIVQGNSILLRSNHHISIKRGYKGFTNFRLYDASSGRDPEAHGNNIDLLRIYFNKTYPEAVLELIGDSFESQESGSNQSKGFDHICQNEHYIPGRASFPVMVEKPWNNLYGYLGKTRGIPGSVIKELIFAGVLYQSEHGNIVFTTPEKDYCEIRGTNTFADGRCKRRDVCSCFIPQKHGWCKHMDQCSKYKKDSFHSSRKVKEDRFWYFVPDHKKQVQIIYICEAAIDAISLYSIHKRGGDGDHENAAYVSIGGVGNQKSIDRIKRMAAQKDIILAVDNDQAGEECRQRNLELLHILSKGKDWNEDLINLNKTQG